MGEERGGRKRGGEIGRQGSPVGAPPDMLATRSEGARERRWFASLSAKRGLEAANKELLLEATAVADRGQLPRVRPTELGADGREKLAEGAARAMRRRREASLEAPCMYPGCEKEREKPSSHSRDSPLGAAFGGRKPVWLLRWPRRARDSGRLGEVGEEEAASRRGEVRGRRSLEAGLLRGLSCQVRVCLILSSQRERC